VAQEQTDANPKKPGSGLIDYLLNYLNMAGTKKSKEFRPMTQPERNRLYFKSMVNPLSFAKVGFSAGIDQANDKPTEWEQGASGYGKRFANILGQYSIQRTVTYGLGSALHEDNRYFNSGKEGFWPRTGYAISSGILARHDDGSRHFSISQVGGVAAGAFLARTWLPKSEFRRRRRRQLRHHHGEQYGIQRGEGISSPSWPRLFKEAQEAGNRLR